MRILDYIRSEDGFTLTEVLVSMMIFLVAICGLWALLLRSESGFLLAEKLGGSAARAVQIDTAIRKTVGSVWIPFWSGDSSPQISSSSASIPYEGGKKDSVASIAYDDTKLILVAGSSRFTFSYIMGLSIEPLLDKESTIIGLVITYELADKSFTTRALFRSASLISGEMR